MRIARRSLLVSAAAGLALVAAGALPSVAQTAASAPTWPTRPVRFIVPLGPGSGVDTGSRLLADRLSARWGQPVIVENRPGGDGVVAIGAFAKAHDDHVLLMSPVSSFTAHSFLYEGLPYKPSDLVPISRVSNTVVSISVPAAMNIASLKDLFELIRKEPGKLNWAGVTGALDFLFEGYLKGAGLDMKKVPYRNPVEAANDLAEGRVQVYEAALAIARPQVLAGKIKLLAVTNSVRAPAFPDVPTVTEAGFPGLAVDGLVGMFGPPNLPEAVRERIAADVRDVAKDPIIGERLETTGQILNVGGAADFAKSIEQQRSEVAKMAKALGVDEKK